MPRTSGLSPERESPEDWTPQTLGDLGRLTRGVSYSTATLTDEPNAGVPYLTLKSFEKGGGFRSDGTKRFTGPFRESDCLTCQDLLVANTDLTPGGDVIGAAALIPEDLARGTVVSSHHVSHLRLPDSVYPRYIELLLQTSEARKLMRTLSAGTTVLNLNKHWFHAVEVVLPRSPEQRRIAEVLDTLDEVIRRTEQVIAKLQQMKQGLLHDLLTRGVNERGELRDPQRHPEQFKDSPLGKIPKQWEVASVGDRSAFVTSGSRGWARFYSNTGALFVRSQNVRTGYLDFSEEQFVRPPPGSEGQRTAVSENDLLVTITGNNVGNVAVIPDAWNRQAFVSQHVGLVRFVEPELAQFVGLFLTAGSPGHRQLIDAQYGQSKPGLSLENLRHLILPLPDRSERKQVIQRAENLQQRIECEQSTASKLRLLKQGLMDDLLTGRVRVNVQEVEAAE